MDVSIIIPVYNVECYIERCLRSVMAQDFTGKIECILVDDCGSDDSIAVARRVLASYSGSIRFEIVSHDHNRGLSAARNTGVSNAKGEYVYFLDSDDEITPDAIRVLYDAIHSREGLDIVCGNIYASWRFTNLVMPAGEMQVWRNRDAKRELLLNHTIPMTAWNRLIRRHLITDAGLWFAEGQLHEDNIWNYFASKHVRGLAAISTPTYIYYQTDGSITAAVNPKRYESLLWMIDTFIDNVDPNQPADQLRCIFKRSLDLMWLINENTRTRSSKTLGKNSDACENVTARKEYSHRLAILLSHAEEVAKKHSCRGMAIRFMCLSSVNTILRKGCNRLTRLLLRLSYKSTQ